MAQQMAKWHEVEDDASRATIMLQKLTTRKEELQESLPRGTEPMPRSELHYCNGLAFTFVRKLGAGVSFESGHGFVVRKIHTGEHNGRPTWTWSAPLFLTVTAAGLGFTLGYTEIDSIIVLDTPEAVQAFTKSQWSVDTDITGAAGGAVGAHLPATAANMSNLRLSDKTFTYSITKGAILDVSLTGLNYATDPAMNRSFYGGHASAQSILDGGVEPPEPMLELYGALDKVLSEFYDSAEGQAQVEVQVEHAAAQAQGGPSTSAAGREASTSTAALAVGTEVNSGPAAASVPAAAAEGSQSAPTSVAPAAAAGSAEIEPAPEQEPGGMPAKVEV